MKSKLFFFIIILSLSFSCRSKKTVTEIKEIVRIDTLEVIKEREIIKRFTDTLTIESPCDSLGNLKPFKQVISTQQGKISIQSQNGSISAKIDLNEQIIENSKSKQVSIKDNKQINTKEVIIYRVPFWCYLVIGLLTAIILLLLRIRK